MKSILERTEKEAQELILEIRKRRREVKLKRGKIRIDLDGAPERKTVRVKKKKEVDTKGVIEGMSKEEMARLLERLEGKTK